MNIFRLICLLFIFSMMFDVHAYLLNIRLADQDEKASRIVLDFKEPHDISSESTQHSLSLTIQPLIDNIIVKNQSKYIDQVQKHSDKKKSYISFNLKKSFVVHQAFWIPATTQHPLHRYVIDLKQKPLTPITLPIVPIEKKKIIIDAGHGGKDPGTIGYRRIYEKNITLMVAKRLAQKLKETGRYLPILIREKDVSMTLAQRLRMARASRGDLFISLHADSCDGKDTRGLSIYTLSAIASDQQAERLARKENKADLIMGIDLQAELPEVANILIDLTKRETMNLSIKLAHSLVSKLRERVFLLRKPHRFANFFILKSADLPSVLIELGYLSNPKEAGLLATPDHQETVCLGIIEALDAYFKQHG